MYSFLRICVKKWLIVFEIDQGVLMLNIFAKNSKSDVYERWSHSFSWQSVAFFSAFRFTIKRQKLNLEYFHTEDMKRAWDDTNFERVMWTEAKRITVFLTRVESAFSCTVFTYHTKERFVEMFFVSWVARGSTPCEPEPSLEELLSSDRVWWRHWWRVLDDCGDVTYRDKLSMTEVTSMMKEKAGWPVMRSLMQTSSRRPWWLHRWEWVLKDCGERWKTVETSLITASDGRLWRRHW